MAWSLEFSEDALRSLNKLDQETAKRILGYLHDRVLKLKNPRDLGKALQGRKYKNIWRYRVGDYRILAEIKDRVMTVYVIEIGNRREIYR
jgi:mRNA interferase RelE/StbE